MKRIVTIILAACVLSVIMPSCKKAFSSGIPDNPQKVVYSDEIKAVFPEEFPVEASALMYGLQVEGKMFTYKALASGSDVTFRFNDTTAIPSRIAYAFYPQTAIDSLVLGNVYCNIASEQKACLNSFDPAAAVFAGHVSDKQTVMQTSFGLYSFTIDQADVASLTVSAIDNALSGHIKVTMDSSVTASALSTSLKEVMVNGGLAKGGKYSVAVLPGSQTKLRFVLKNSYDVIVWDKTVQGDFSLTPGKTVDLGVLGNPDVSSLAISASSSEYVGYKVKSIIGYSAASKLRIFGGDVNQTFESDKSITARFFGLEPADYSADKIWYVITMEKDGKGIALPIECDGFVVPAATEVSQDLGVISESRNAAPWFCPYEDTRLKCGAGYAFGDANTYLIQYKGGVYSGDLDPDPAIPESVTIDYRVRGDLFSAPKPEGVSFEWKTGYGNSGQWGTYTSDRSKGGNVTSYSISHDADNYKVTITNTGAQWGTPILLMKKGDEILWAWVFWNVASDGSRLKAIDFGETQLANMDIGQCSSPDQAAKITAKIAEIRRTTFYYQWGRPIPTFSANNVGAYFAQTDSRNHATPRIPVCDRGAVSVEEALKHPGELLHNTYTAGSASDHLYDWVQGGVEAQKDLWGNDGKGGSVKSIYDPCPKGWKVPDAQVYKSVFPSNVVKYSTQTYPQENTTGYQGVYVAKDLLFSCGGCFLTNIGASKAVNSGGIAYGTSNTANGNGRWWTNEFAGGTKVYLFNADYYYVKYDKATENTSRYIGMISAEIGRAHPVRCQIDTDNR